MTIQKAKQTLNLLHNASITLLALILTACTTTTGLQNAPIERKENVYYKYNGPVAIDNLNQKSSGSHGDISNNETKQRQEYSQSTNDNNRLYHDKNPDNYDEIPPAKPTNQNSINEPNTLERQLEEKEMNDSKTQGSQIYYDKQNQDEADDSVDTKNIEQKMQNDHSTTQENPNELHNSPQVNSEANHSNQIPQHDSTASSQKEKDQTLIQEQNNNIDHENKANASSEPQRTSNLQYNSYAIASPLGLPEFSWPVNGKVIRHMSDQPEEFKEGISIAAPEGTTVRCAADGEVIYAGNNQDKFGNLVILKHPKGYLTAYAHNSDIMVKKGDKIKRGQPIAKVGTTGDLGKANDAQKSQLYFSIRKDRMVVNPEKKLGSN